jgi:hypothetical protein
VQRPVNWRAVVTGQMNRTPRDVFPYEQENDMEQMNEGLGAGDSHAEFQPATYGTPTDTEPTQPIETKQYADGTTATGTAPLPDVSPTADTVTEPTAPTSAAVEAIPQEAEPTTVAPVDDNSPSDLDIDPTAITGTQTHADLLSEITAHCESMEAALADRVRASVAKLRAALGL